MIIILEYLNRAIVWITTMWDTSLSMFSISIILAMLAISNLSLAYLLPLSLGIDLLILYYAIKKNYRKVIVEMIYDNILFENLGKTPDEQESLFLDAIRKTKQFKAASRFGKKRIISYISKNIVTHNQAFAFYSDESFVLLHKNYDTESDIDKFRWIHEMAHCCWHTMIELNQTISRIQAIMLTLLIAASSIILQSCCLLIIGESLCLIIFLLRNALAIDNRKEMGADLMALSIFCRLYGERRAEKVARIAVNAYYLELLYARGEKDWKRYLNLIINLLHFEDIEAQKKFVLKVRKRIFEENMDKTIKGELQRTKLMALSFKLPKKRFRQVPPSYGMYLTMNPPAYYFVYCAMMLLAYTSLSKALFFLDIHWWCLFFGIIPIIIMIVLVLSIFKLKLFKQYYVESIKNKHNGSREN